MGTPPTPLLTLLARDPREGVAQLPNRAQAWLEGRARPPAYEARSWAEAMPALSERVGADLDVLAAEPAASELEAQLRERIAELPADAPIPLVHNADFGLARLAYAVCRATRPQTVVETGVAWGVTSTFLCRALAANDRGTLHSVDLAAGGGAGAGLVGALVPAELRDRWRLRRGASRRVLAPLVREVGWIDLFLHDSRHTWANIRRELRTAAAAMRPGGVVLADDVERNSAWAEWTGRRSPSFSTVLAHREKAGLCGVAVL